MAQLTIYVKPENMHLLNRIKNETNVNISEFIFNALNAYYIDDIRHDAIEEVQKQSNDLINDIKELIILDQDHGKMVINDLVEDYCNDLHSTIDKI